MNTQNNNLTKATDYSQKTSWYKISEITKDVDTFYIYSTMYFGANEGDPDYATLDNAEMMAGINFEHAIKSSVFEESTNLFIPLYRQSSMKYAAEVFLKDGIIEAALTGIPYDDITAALDYYFENYNNGRPFIIAGHSQGSAKVAAEFFGPDGRHGNDYMHYYNNIKANAAKRIAAYKAGR